MNDWVGLVMQSNIKKKVYITLILPLSKEILHMSLLTMRHSKYTNTLNVNQELNFSTNPQSNTRRQNLYLPATELCESIKFGYRDILDKNCAVIGALISNADGCV